MRFDLSIQMDNVAFGDDPAAEVARILNEIARKFERGDTAPHGVGASGSALDFNGNRVARWEVSA